ncbi:MULTISPECIES: LLM class flavin-dependent oxidoreductase [unclassified Amycolatopsis]|uniref:LLM class flavin-dependent oxidoreductase n=1 Tax=unclassified Amycolatopsis TaxID=2618356 RepID=UPI00287667E0|nr:MULTISPECIES: LLM class flavin-dependent oxidoreductase [unclassified Amycolatopsis]MDS0135808.1 LLM class flavin-dependent oxidoreductase [Amycolatopsis sp. 505]MDS0145591.1 LLM class flavin-dependent oxidoreductase [Amycolatopsis sp. CM201R]
MTFHLGFLTHVHGEGRVPAGRLYRDLVELFAAAEELGYQSGWVAQHHFQPEHGRLPSPLVLLAAAAERTRRIHLGTAVTVLPLEDPVRLAEDAIVLDALSGGRLQLGLGSGTPVVDDFAVFGRDVGNRHAEYDRHLRTLTEALTGHELSERLWESSLRPQVLTDAAVSGRGLLLGVGPADRVQAGLAAGYLDAGPRTPRIAAVRGIFPGSSRAAAAAQLETDVARYRSLHVRAGWAPHEDISLTELLRLMNVQHGTREDIVESLRADPVFAGPGTHLIAAVQAESSTLGQALDRLETIATKIAPELGWRP